MADITIKQATAALAKLPKQVMQDMVKSANAEVIAEILGTRGIGLYPPQSSGNQPPTPYYVRGTGMQYGSHNDGKSERYGSQWQKPTVSGYKTISENTATYGQYLVSDASQARHMAVQDGQPAWRRIIDVVKDKTVKIGKMYGAWVMRSIRKVGL